MYGVIKFQSPFEKLKKYPCSNEVKLYKATILQAVIDASNISSSVISRKNEIEAKHWIFGNGAHFQEICYLADMEPSFIIKITRYVIKHQAIRKSQLFLSVLEGKVPKEDC